MQCDRHAVHQDLGVGGQQRPQRLLPRLAELAPGPGLLELLKPGQDRRLVVGLALGLFEDHLGDPHRPPHGREREGEEPGDQAHASLLSSVSAKLNGGMGPT